MEKFRVTFEMTNGESHFYEIERESAKKLYELINDPLDGWIEVTQNGETHFINADKLTRVKIISESNFKKKQIENEQQIVDSFISWG